MAKSTSLKSILFILFFFCSLKFYAQISIVASDWEPALQVGQKYTTYSDSTTSQANIGSPGQTSWDFTGVVADNVWLTESKPVATSPYAADFPGAEYVSNYEGTFNGVYSNSWVYSSIGADYVTLGTGTYATTPAGNLTTKIKFTPGWSHYTFPIQQGYTHIYTGTQTVTSIITIPGFGDFPTVTTQAYTDEQVVDAWGIVKMPNGKRLNALRIKETITITNNLTNSTSVRFIILTKTGEMVSISPVDKNVTSGLVAVTEISWYNGSGESIPEETVNAPSSLSATVSGNSINLGWTDNSTNETGFTIERSSPGSVFSVLTTLGANVTTYTDATAVAGVAYTYRIKATGGTSDSGFSNTSVATIPMVIPVADPSGLVATAGSSSINLSWVDNSNNETGFSIERSSPGSAFAVLAEVGANITTHIDATAVAGIVYTYRVKATGGTSGSGYSNTSVATIPAIIPVADPSGLAATAGSNSIDLIWADNSTNETGFTIERSSQGSAFSVLTTVGANLTTYTDATAVAGIQYSYRVKATGGTSGSGYSNTSVATIPVVITVADPSGLTATAGENSITLGWSDNSDNETGFVIERSASLSGTFTVIANLDANSTSFTDNDVTAGFQYFYKVKALGSGSNSGYSNTANATVPLIVTVADPSGLAANASESSIDLSWNDNSDNETGFAIERSANGGVFTIIATVGANATTYTDVDVAAGNDYTYRIKATGNSANSGFSNTSNATIPVAETVAAPTGLTAVAGENSIELNWIDNSDNETGFVVERAEGSAGFAPLATVGPNVHSYSDVSALAGVEYTYQVKATGSALNSSYSNIATASITVVLEIKEMLSKNFSLGQNYPNPFTTSTTIAFELQQSGPVSITVFDVTGKRIEQIINAEYSAGKYTVQFDRKGLSKGIYYYLLVTKRSSETRKMVAK
jgi:ribosomal protein S6E (S10)